MAQVPPTTPTLMEPKWQASLILLALAKVALVGPSTYSPSLPSPVLTFQLRGVAEGEQK